MTLHWPAGSLADGDRVVLTPERARWRFCGLRVVRLGVAETRTIATGPDEMAVLPLSGSVVVDVDGERFLLGGRDDVFSRVTDWAYVPRDAEVRLSSAAGAEVALPSARATRRMAPRYVPADAVPVEIRGAGPATRQVINFCTPDAFAGADRLMAVELLTPDGNWSSYPPHRHDDSPECPANNEEIYYFRIEGDAGFGFHRLYTPDGEIDEHVVVEDGDVFLIPRGYHGPSVAAPGYTMYYLNILAGPGDERSMAFCDDPAHHWVRDSWEGMPSDPRCPMTSAAGRVIS
ncbi:MAG TPA: 5-deoxy-glucuronate isomerase [Acidimicrobiales bacterium]|nr:5-deoxy-glucuronate isomerase [Acidimicrobiales bacterium]